jgi:hypothetical protein
MRRHWKSSSKREGRMSKHGSDLPLLPEAEWPLVSIVWVDIEGASSWNSMAEVNELRKGALSRYAYTVGWLLESDEEAVVVASTIRPDISLEGLREHQFNDITVIKTGTIVNIGMLTKL